MNKVLLYWLCLAMIFILPVTSCKVSKQSSSTEVTNSADSISILTNLLKISEQTISSLRSENNTYKYAGVQFRSVDTAEIRRLASKGLISKAEMDAALKKIADDCKNEIAISADGSIKASGNISSASVQESTYKKIIASWQHRYDSLLLVKQEKQIVTVDKIIEKESKAKGGFLNGIGFTIMLVLIAFVLGCILTYLYVKKKK